MANGGRAAKKGLNHPCLKDLIIYSSDGESYYSASEDENPTRDQTQPTLGQRAAGSDDLTRLGLQHRL
eukprot:2894380-Amphidinium_carterae.1